MLPPSVRVELFPRLRTLVLGFQLTLPQEVQGSRLVLEGGSPIRPLSFSVAAFPWSTGWRLKAVSAGEIEYPPQTWALFWMLIDFPGPGVASPQTCAKFFRTTLPFVPRPPVIPTLFPTSSELRLTPAYPPGKIGSPVAAVI